MRAYKLMISTIFACFAGPGAAQFMPPNNLHLEDAVFRIHNVSSEQFNKVLDQVEKYYKPLIKQHFKANFVIRRKWSNNTVNAFAIQYGNQWEIEMYGGLARRPEVTPDGFLAVACHEVGHHLGGYPFRQWASNEGQSDYFAMQACLRNLWQDDTATNAKFAATIPAHPKKLCNQAWEGLDDRNLCYRTMMAGKSLGDLLSGKSAKFETPDRKVVSRTLDTHPAGQCRLDTYMAAALCKAKFEDSIIPGKQTEGGRNSQASERDSADYTCHALNMDVLGLRPRCWFRPLINE